MGLPTSCTLASGKKRRASSKAVKTTLTNLPSSLLVSPGSAFCSCTAVGMPISHAAITTGPLA